jgi:hypothetical protein
MRGLHVCMKPSKGEAVVGSSSAVVASERRPWRVGGHGFCGCLGVWATVDIEPHALLLESAGHSHGSDNCSEA